MWAFLLTPILCLLGEIYKTDGFIGVLIFFAVIVIVFGTMLFLEMKSDGAAQRLQADEKK